MAERDGTPGPVVPVGPTGEPATRPKVWPWLLLYTGGRIAIAAVLVFVLWTVGLGSYAGLLFGVLLSMPVAYFALRSVRERLNQAIVAYQEQRRRSKEELRARLSGDETD